MPRTFAPDDGPADTVESYISRGNAMCKHHLHKARCNGSRIIPPGRRYYLGDLYQQVCEECMLQDGWSLDEINPDWEPDYDDKGD